MNGQRSFFGALANPWAVFILSAGLASLIGCGGGRTASNTIVTGANVQGSNVTPVQVNLGPTGNNVDQLLATVTVCVPGTSTCQTIQSVFVDTGSEGLRILSSQLNVNLPRMNDANGNPVGNCITFADNSFLWGPVATADIQIGGEKAASVPVQIIGAPNFAGVPSDCNSGGTPDDSVAALGANAILGLGVFRQDCGPACAGTSQIPNVYFSCPSSGCSVTSMPLQDQLQNPVWLFPQDNNGLLISLPSISANGALTVTGSLIFGIGTQSNNGLGSAKVFTTDDVGNFTTSFNGTPYYPSFIDSGSNGIFFLDSTTLNVPACSDNNSFYCPSSVASFTATNTGANGVAGTVSFNIANADALFQTGNAAFNNLGGPNAGSFDWGLAFFFGRNVFVGIESQNTPAGAGPYWAY